MKVLVLDDDLSILKVVKTVLTLSGHKVDCADNAVVAVEMARKQRYDIVLFDYKMEEHDGRTRWNLVSQKRKPDAVYQGHPDDWIWQSNSCKQCF